MKKNVQNVRMMTPVIVFGIALLSGLIALVGIYNFRSERHRLEEETQLRMESLVSEMEGKVTAIENALVSKSRGSYYYEKTDDEIFESLDDFFLDVEVRVIKFQDVLLAVLFHQDNLSLTGRF